MSTEPTHFLTLMNNGKGFSSLDNMACSYQCSVPANLFKYNLNDTKNNMKSQIKKKEWWSRGITNTNIFQKKASHEGTKTFLGKKIMGRLF